MLSPERGHAKPLTTAAQMCEVNDVVFIFSYMYVHVYLRLFKYMEVSFFKKTVPEKYFVISVASE